jgi:hypothetical protein
MGKKEHLLLSSLLRPKEHSHARHSFHLPSLLRHPLLSTRSSMQIVAMDPMPTNTPAPLAKVASLVGSSDANAIPSAAGAAGSSRADAGAPPVASFADASDALVAAGTSAAAAALMV